METGSYTIIAKPIKTLELHYQMIQFLKMIIINDPLPLWDYSGLMKQIIQKNITWLKLPTSWRQTSWLFTIMTEDLKSGPPRTNKGGLKLGASEFYSTPFYSRHSRDLEFVSWLARVHNSWSLFQSNVCNLFFFCRRFSYCPFYRCVSYSGVSARQELTVQVQHPNQWITPPP